MKLKDNFILMLLVILSSFLIFYQFTFIPKYLTFDEIEFTKLALSLSGKPYTPYSALATGHSTLYFYTLLFSLKTFGINVFALRLPAAIFGIFSVILFYFVSRLSFRSRLSRERNLEVDFSVASLLRNDKWFAFLLGFIFLTSRWFLNFSRFAFEPTFLLFLELTSIYFLLRSSIILNEVKDLSRMRDNSNKLRDSSASPQNDSFFLILSGLFAGLAFNSYTPGRIFFLLPLFLLTLKTLRTLKLYKLVYFIIPFLIIIAPLTLYLSTTKETRVDQQFFLKNSKMTANEKISGLWYNISSNTLMFFTKGDINGRHNYPGKPALNPVLGILFVAGLIVSIKNIKNFYNQFFLSYFFLSLFPALMTYPWENPNMLRTFTVIPSVVYFVGQGIIVIARSETTKQSLKLLRLPRSLWSLAMTVVIVFLILLSSLYELRTYFKYQAKVFQDSFEIHYPLEKAIKLKNPYEKNQ